MVKPILGILIMVFPVIKTRLDSFISCRPEPGPNSRKFDNANNRKSDQKSHEIGYETAYTVFFKLQLVVRTL